MMRTPENTKYKYRDRIRIIYDILECIRNNSNAQISLISRHSNLSHYAVVEKAEQLVKAGLISIRLGEGKFNKMEVKLFNITEAGQKFHNQLEQIYSQLEKQGIDII